MAASCPAGFDAARLRELVAATYSAVAKDPSGDFHFHRGATYAVEFLDYDAWAVAALPRVSTDRFAGVGNPHLIGPIHAGEVVLDHACGAGLDLLLAARRVGPRGRAIGVDLTPAMRDAARRGAEAAGLGQRVEIRAGVFEALPVADDSVDVVISNGVLNLAADKLVVLREVARVLRPGGRLYLADVVVQRELKLEARLEPELWAACIGGALPELELAELAVAAGLEHPQYLQRFDCFRGTTAAAKVSADLRVTAINFLARKPQGQQRARP